jgi:hypothetical protein
LRLERASPTRLFVVAVQNSGRARPDGTHLDTDIRGDSTAAVVPTQNPTPQDARWLATVVAVLLASAGDPGVRRFTILPTVSR